MRVREPSVFMYKPWPVHFGVFSVHPVFRVAWDPAQPSTFPVPWDRRSPISPGLSLGTNKTDERHSPRVACPSLCSRVSHGQQGSAASGQSCVAGPMLNLPRPCPRVTSCWATAGSTRSVRSSCCFQRGRDRSGSPRHLFGFQAVPAPSALTGAGVQGRGAVAEGGYCSFCYCNHHLHYSETK